MDTMKVAIHPFVLRQTRYSPFSFFTGTWPELQALIEANMDKAVQGYKPGVLLVPVPAHGFVSGVSEVDKDTKLVATFEARRAGETPHIVVRASGAVKLPAKAVECVIYSHEILVEENDASSDAPWELVSINARPTEEPEPAHPVAMARNQLGLPGGTKAEYSAEEFARAIMYWSTRAMAG
jgi:hypothetical protein